MKPVPEVRKTLIRSKFVKIASITFNFKIEQETEKAYIGEIFASGLESMKTALPKSLIRNRGYETEKALKETWEITKWNFQLTPLK